MFDFVMAVICFYNSQYSLIYHCYLYYLTLTGGEGKVGKITEIRGWDSESGRSVANVAWQSGSTNVYRVGHKGKVDLKYVTAGAGMHYYKEHLPVLGKNILIHFCLTCDESH